jgi:hypothetical protein
MMVESGAAECRPYRDDRHVEELLHDLKSEVDHVEAIRVSRQLLCEQQHEQLQGGEHHDREVGVRVELEPYDARGVQVRG